MTLGLQFDEVKNHEALDVLLRDHTGLRRLEESVI
jgi:hypothetical protein